MNRATILACALVSLLVAGGSATAASLITSSDIKNGTIKSEDIKDGYVKSSDIKNGTVKSEDIKDGYVKSSDIKNGAIKNEDIKKTAITMDRFSKATQDKINKAGTPGPAGGATGPQGPKGDKGDPGPTLSSGNWGVVNRNTIGSPVAQLRSGPFDPPVGDGSLNLTVGGGPPLEKLAFGNEVDFQGLRIADLSAVGYSVYQTGENTGPSAANLPNLSFEVDPNVVGVVADYSSLVYQPAAVPANTWSTINAATGAGWYFTNGPTAVATTCGQGAAPQHFCTLAEVKAAAPNAVVTLSAAIAKGRDYEWHGAVDGLRINNKVFDFEETGVVERDAG